MHKLYVVRDMFQKYIEDIFMSTLFYKLFFSSKQFVLLFCDRIFNL